MQRRHGQAAGCPDGVHLHAHQIRHTFAHTWHKAGGDSIDLMRIMGWRSPEMLHRYGASAASERAHQRHRQLRLGIGSERTKSDGFGGRLCYEPAYVRTRSGGRSKSTSEIVFELVGQPTQLLSRRLMSAVAPRKC